MPVPPTILNQIVIQPTGRVLAFVTAMAMSAGMESVAVAVTAPAVTRQHTAPRPYPNYLIGKTPMTLISLNTAALLMGVSKRTLWRRIAAGSLPVSRATDTQGRTLLALDDIAGDIGLPPAGLEEEVIATIEHADAGLAREQLELALIYLEAGQTDKALSWLQLSANQGDSEAMLFLGETQLQGKGADSRAGLNWIRRAAIAGHPLALEVMEALSGQLSARGDPST